MKVWHRATSTMSRRTAVWLAGVFLLCCGYFLPLPDADAGARLDTTLAIVQHHTVAIDPYRWNTHDVAFYHGHYYSVTAPGQALFGVPIAAMYSTFVRFVAGRRHVNDIGSKRWDGRLSYFLLQYLEGIGMDTVPATLLLLLFYWFLGYFSESPINRAILTAALGLATMIFPYAHAFYAHVPVAALLFAGFVLLYILSHADAARGPTTHWLLAHPRVTLALAGLLLGVSETFEYPVAIIICLLGIYAVVSLPRRLLPYLVLGMLPGLMIVMGYNYAAYHNPLVTGYSAHSVSYRKELGHGLLAALHVPPPLAALYGTSFSPYRGLFFLSPFLLLAFPGLAVWARRGGREWGLFLAIPVVYFCAMATYPIWYAGDAVGPRFLIPTLPFLALPVIFMLDRATRWTARLAIYGLIVISAAAVWVEAVGTLYGYPVAKNHNPLFSYSLPHLVRGQYTPNFGSLLFGVSSRAAILPLCVFVAVWSFWIWRRAKVARPIVLSPGITAAPAKAGGR